MFFRKIESVFNINETQSGGGKEDYTDKVDTSWQTLVIFTKVTGSNPVLTTQQGINDKENLSQVYVKLQTDRNAYG